jgi:hypothetical protein
MGLMEKYQLDAGMKVTNKKRIQPGASGSGL